jgi:hypothetical protein
LYYIPHYPAGTTTLANRAIIALSCSAKSENIEKIRDWNTFILYVAFLHRKTFDEGLPIREAIDVGEFSINNAGNLFTGKPIIEAYRLSGKIDFSGCALTPNAD